jgi:hypothetical protein
MLNLSLILSDLDPTGELAQHFHDAKLITLSDIIYWISDCENATSVSREAKLLLKILKQNSYIIRIGKSKKSGFKKSDTFTKLLRKIVEYEN